MTVTHDRVTVQGCFLSGVIALVLSVALSSCFVHVVNASAHVNHHCMALGINADGTPIYTRRFWPTGVLFSPEDEEAYVWMNITLDERMNISAQWCFPNGSIYRVDMKIRDEGSHYVWFSIAIRDILHACMCADQWYELWEVKIFADSTPLFTEEFHINQPPPFPWRTTLVMAGVVVAAIALPVLVVFSRMKEPPPKFGFALSLVGGLMVAIAGFFRGALGGSTVAFGLGGVMTVLYSFITPLFPGLAISISAVRRKGVAVLVLSVFVLAVISLLCANTLIRGFDIHLYTLPLYLAVLGSVCSILGGFLIRRRTQTCKSHAH